MPFSNQAAKDAYQHSIKKVCDNHSLEIRRADDIFSTSPVYDDIVKEIKDASIIIVDITDNNPNVFYELGMAHIVKQNQTIIITQGEFNKTPFDVSHFRIIKYENTIAGKVDLEHQLDLTLKTLLTDFKTLNKDAYELVINVFLAGQQEHKLATLLGIRDTSSIVKYSDRLVMEYSYLGRATMQGSSIKNNVESLFKLGYVSIQNDIVTLTEEGRAFAEYVEMAGIKCHIFNDQKFEEEYVSAFPEIFAKKPSDK